MEKQNWHIDLQKHYFKPIKINKMQIKSMFTAFTLKALLVISCITIGFSCLSLCSAQSTIVGRWKEVSVKQFYNAEYAKKMGRAVVEGQAAAGSTYQWEFKSDHTYVINGGRGKDNKTTGEWSVSGDQLTMKSDAQVRKGGAEIYTFLITGNTMTRTMLLQPPYNEMIFKQEDTSIRL
jgi:Lipocalin-like domain